MATRSRRRTRDTEETKLLPTTVHVVSRAPGNPDKEDKEETWELDAQVFETDPAYVTIKAGVTKSPQQYESVRIDVSVSVPCYREDIEKTAEAVSELVYETLSAEITAYLGDVDGEED